MLPLPSLLALLVMSVVVFTSPPTVVRVTMSFGWEIFEIFEMQVSLREGSRKVGPLPWVGLSLLALREPLPSRPLSIPLPDEGPAVGTTDSPRGAYNAIRSARHLVHRHISDLSASAYHLPEVHASFPGVAFPSRSACARRSIYHQVPPPAMPHHEDWFVA